MDWALHAAKDSMCGKAGSFGGRLYLGDFGIAKRMTATLDVASTFIGTPCCLAPEMCQDLPYSSKADVWVCKQLEPVILVSVILNLTDISCILHSQLGKFSVGR